MHYQIHTRTSNPHSNPADCREDEQENSDLYEYLMYTTSGGVITSPELLERVAQYFDDERDAESESEAERLICAIDACVPYLTARLYALSHLIKPASVYQSRRRLFYAQKGQHPDEDEPYDEDWIDCLHDQVVTLLQLMSLLSKQPKGDRALKAQLRHYQEEAQDLLNIHEIETVLATVPLDIRAYLSSRVLLLQDIQTTAHLFLTSLSTPPASPWFSFFKKLSLFTS